jgi:hypothetical protein
LQYLQIMGSHFGFIRCMEIRMVSWPPRLPVGGGENNKTDSGSLLIGPSRVCNRMHSTGHLIALRYIFIIIIAMD